MSTTNQVQPNLPPNTIMPKNEDLFESYFTDLYAEIADTVNRKDENFYPIAITSSFVDILNLPRFGAFIVAISGSSSTLPTITASLTKSDATAAGTIAVLGSQVGTGAWAGNALSFKAAATAFQVKHDLTGVAGSFNIRVIGTQTVG